MKPTNDQLHKIITEGERRFGEAWTAAIEQGTKAARDAGANHLTLQNRILVASLVFHILHLFRLRIMEASGAEVDLADLKFLELCFESDSRDDQDRALARVRQMIAKRKARKAKPQE